MTTNKPNPSSILIAQLDSCDANIQRIMGDVMDRQDRLEEVSKNRAQHEREADELFEKAKRLQTQPLQINTRLQLAQENFMELLYPDT
jgi:uncharacterized protein YfcZ (UPF0381/DUF406 family)